MATLEPQTGTSDPARKYILIDDKHIISLDQNKDEQPEPILELNSSILQLLHDYEAGLKAENRIVTPIHVNDIAIAIAKLYELIRKVIDWKEDYALRRSAIERILKRILFSQVAGFTGTYNENPQTMAETIANNLIRGGHLPNDEIPLERVSEVAVAINKHLQFLQHASTTREFPSIKERMNYTTFIIEIMACEIEDILSNPIKEKALIRTMSRLMSERIRILPKGELSQEVVNAHIFISVCRTLYDLDDAYILYNLLQFQFPDWKDMSETQIQELKSKMITIWGQREQVLNHPISRDLFNICEKNDTVFVLLDDLLQKHRHEPEKIKDIIEHKTKFTEEITEHYQKRYKSLKTRLFRLAVFSTLSVFASNWFTFYLVEVPLAKIFYERFNPFTMFIDFLIPTAVMFFLVIIIRPPPAKNIDNVLATTFNMVYKDEKTPHYEIRLRPYRNRILTFFLLLFYILLTIVGFASVGFIFYKARLPITSVIFDTLTIALTVFAAVTIRNKSKELNVDEKTSFFEFILDMFSLPLAKVGSYLANKWKEYNIVAILFSFLIETPFNLIMKIIESWSDYLKERRAELH